jgi:hypothetical protein
MARFSPGARIGQVHGTFRLADTESGAPDSITFAMYHPAAALHQGSLKATLFKDMEGVPAALLEARRTRSLESRPLTAPATAEVADRPAKPAPIAVSGVAPEPLSVVADSSADDAESEPTDQLPLF